jgi:hypothetical protein
MIIADLNRTLRGWFEYFKHSYHPTFKILDSWVRRRLRSLLLNGSGAGESRKCTEPDGRDKPGHDGVGG